jgi:hypothetical protein
VRAALEESLTARTLASRLLNVHIMWIRFIECFASVCVCMGYAVGGYVAPDDAE